MATGSTKQMDKNLPPSPAAFGTTSLRTAATAATASAAFTAAASATAGCALAACALAAATATASAAFTAAFATATALVHLVIFFIGSSESFICHYDFSYRMVASNNRFAGRAF